MLAQQMLKDWLLWVLLTVSIIINSVLLLWDPSGVRVCQTAYKLVEYYGIQISSESISRIEQDLQSIINEACDAYQKRYGESTYNVLDLYHGGCFESDEEFEKVMLLQRMQAYGKNTLQDGNQSKDFSVSELSGNRVMLYKKLLPIACIELIIIAAYVMLRNLETGTVTNVSALEYSSILGRRIDLFKITVSLSVIAFIWLLVHACMIGPLVLIYPGSISESSSLLAVLSKFSPAVKISESGYLASWLCVDFVIVLIYSILVAAAGLLFRNSLIGFLTLLAYIVGSFCLQMIPFENNTYGDIFAQWNPVGLFVQFKDGAITIMSEKWFLAGDPEYALFGNELMIIAAWLAFSIITLALAWQFFKRRELTM